MFAAHERLPDDECNPEPLGIRNANRCE